MKQHRNHTPAALLLLMSCAVLSGCGPEEEALYVPETSAAETGTDANAETSAAPAETVPTETEPLSYLQQYLENTFGYAADDSTRDNISQVTMMLFTEIAEAGEMPAELDEEHLPVQDGTVQMQLNSLIYTKDGAQSELSTAFVLCWNGSLYDFSLDGEQSTDGVLYMDMKLNCDYTAVFRAENLPVQAGENTFYFCAVPYCPETGIYWGAMSYTGYYEAEEARAGQSPMPLTAESELEPACIISVTDREEAMTDMNIAPDSRISMFSDDRYKVHANPTFYLNVANFRNAEGPSNRSGIGMVFVDGRLSPVWNGAYFASVSASDREYTRRYAVQTDFPAGEHRNVSLVYAELQDDKDMYGRTFAYSQICYCDMVD